MTHPRGSALITRSRAPFSLLLAAAVGLASSPAAAGAIESSDPNPLRRAPTLRAQAISAGGGAVAITWREGRRSGSDRLLLGLSRDGGASFARGDGSLRKFRLAGLPGRGSSVAICGRSGARSVFAATTLRANGDRRRDADVLLTRRGIARPARDAGQLFVTSSAARRQARDAEVACVGGHHLAVAWIQRKNGKTRARLAIRKFERSGRTTLVRRFNLGRANLNGGIDVAATAGAVHVVWTRGDRNHLFYERFRVASKSNSRFERGLARGIDWRDVARPELAARGRTVVVAYSDEGDVRVAVSTDNGRSFGPAERLADGSRRTPSRARSLALIGDRIVVSAIDRSSGQRVATRYETFDLGATWGGVEFGADRLHLADLEKADAGGSSLKEVRHIDRSGRDVLRASYERP